MKILICGLSGSGKTTLACNLIDKVKGHTTEWFNADVIRTMYDDWDFSKDGRIRQANRIKTLSDTSIAEIVICDFIAPTQSIRDYFDADFIIWMDTIKECIYEDTNKVFEKPEKYDLRIASHKFTNYILDIFSK